MRYHVYMNDTEDQGASARDSEQQPARVTVATVTIEGEGVSITRDVDEPTMSSIIGLIFRGSSETRGGRRAVTQVQQRQVESTIGAGEWDPELTLGEFLVEAGASTFPQKICAAGYYLIKFDGADSFDRDGVRAALVQAHEDMPANFGRDFGVAASSHFIAAKQGEAGRYYVPTTGRKAVESHFQDVPKRRTTRRTRKGSSSSTSGDAE
jgi:hypothetical protein